ncbi:hypothetical protein ABL78_5411 [Leptomonas seymouri]|uniref:Myotubularin-related 12-like C-terminal domain-containing protein n=1 Tax=Leptomonas seymouri TaxID=5684 RepID=A0A0N1I4U8_LEPSE|nr:hypothetical protein ABL78_5411 [Leptomonas seymouri]|eukprot:KPI85530.1 hypothetical protein ABL78_5411 [Leptomonas seymouri]
MASVMHDLHQYRYITSVRHPLPWAHIRHVSIPELRNESPDLPLMANLISGLSGCDVSLKEIREHSDADVLQLVEVLQACLQFALWSQNILKEKLLELQSSQVAKRISARQLDHAESRCQALAEEVQTLKTERDTLSLGTANLRTSLVQLETTVKMQERQLKQERERTSLLVAKLEKAFADNTRSRGPIVPVGPLDTVQWRPDASGTLRCPTCGHCRHRSESHSASVDAPTKKQKACTTLQLRQHSLASSETYSDTATSYTDDSMMNAEAEFICETSRRRDRRRRAHRHSSGRGADSVFPSPCVDWRTLVRYIIHEEKRTPAWPTAPVVTQTPEPIASAPLPGSSPATAVAAAALPALAVPAPSHGAPQPAFWNQLPSLVSNFTTAVAGDVGEYVRDTAARTQEFVTTTVHQQMRELADTQQASVQKVQADPLPASPNSPPAAAAAPIPPPAQPVPSSLAMQPVASTEGSRVDAARPTQSPSEPPAAPATSAPPARPSSSPLTNSAHSADKAGGTKTFLATARLPQFAVSDVAGSRRSEGLNHNSALLSRDDGKAFESLHRGSRSSSFFSSPAASPVLETPSQVNSMSRRYDSCTMRSAELSSRGSLLPAFSPDILRTPNASEHDGSSPSAPATPTKQSSCSVDGASNNSTLPKKENEGAGPSDGHLRPPTCSSTSREDSYRSSSDDSLCQRSSGGGDHSVTAAAPQTIQTSKMMTSFHSPRSAKPSTTPPMYPSLTVQQSGSPLTTSTAPGGFSLYKAVSLHSSTRSDASGGSTHASSQMLRDTQRELEALLAEDAAAERAKVQR